MNTVTETEAKNYASEKIEAVTFVTASSRSVKGIEYIYAVAQDGKAASIGVKRPGEAEFDFESAYIYTDQLVAGEYYARQF